MVIDRKQNSAQAPSLDRKNAKPRQKPSSWEKKVNQSQSPAFFADLV